MGEIMIGGKVVDESVLADMRLPVDRGLWETTLDTLAERDISIRLLEDLVHFIVAETQIELGPDDEYYWGDGTKIQISFDYQQMRTLEEVLQEYSDEQ